MYLLSVSPFALIPRPASQTLAYYSLKPALVGSLVSVPLRKRKIMGVVIDCQIADKLTIKRASFEFRGIDKIISAEKIIEDWQIKLAEYLGEYYWTSPGLFLKMMIPLKIHELLIKNYDSRNKKSKKSQSLILVPEVGQIEPTIKNFKLKDYVIIHSGLTQKQYLNSWLKIKIGQVRNIIGTRIAVFAPFLKLEKIIIIDESNPRHKSWDRHPQYRVHEVAKKLSELHGAALIFEANVPSVETNYLAEKNHSFKIIFPIKKLPRSLAETKIIDMKQELKEGNFSIFSRALQRELQETIKNKKQAILFINRRGAGTFVLCRDCGFVARCPNCDVPLVQHIIKENKYEPKLICHHCGHNEGPPGLCPQCRGIKIKAFGAGTQKVELELKKFFPQINVFRLDADTAQTAQKQKEIIQKFSKREADVLIATQMLFSYFSSQSNNLAIQSRLSVVDPRKIKSAYGRLDFSGQFNNLRLVSLISADTLLHLPDFRSGERTFQTITKLKNIAPKSSAFIVQSYNPENHAIRYAAQGNWPKFYQEELASRAELGYPPFSQIIKLRFSHHSTKKTEEEAKILAVKLTRQIKNFSAYGGPRLKSGQFSIFNFHLLGPSPAFIPKTKGKYIWQILIKYKLSRGNQKEWLDSRNKVLSVIPSNWQVEVDPESIL